MSDQPPLRSRLHRRREHLRHRLAASEWDRLKASFDSGEDAVIEVSEQAATVWLRASQIAWARLHTRESRIGF